MCLCFCLRGIILHLPLCKPSLWLADLCSTTCAVVQYSFDLIEPSMYVYSTDYTCDWSDLWVSCFIFFSPSSPNSQNGVMSQIHYPGDSHQKFSLLPPDHDQLLFCAEKQHSLNCVFTSPPPVIRTVRTAVRGSSTWTPDALPGATESFCLPRPQILCWRWAQDRTSFTLHSSLVTFYFLSSTHLFPHRLCTSSQMVEEVPVKINSWR